MNEYKAGIKKQKSTGWGLIVLGSLLTLTIIGAIIGIPMLVFGILKVTSKEVGPLQALASKHTLRK